MDLEAPLRIRQVLAAQVGVRLLTGNLHRVETRGRVLPYVKHCSGERIALLVTHSAAIDCGLATVVVLDHRLAELAPR